MLPPEIAPILYREIARVATHPEWSLHEKILALASLQERLFSEVTKKEQIVFSTLFARICYTGHIHHFQPDTLRLIHAFRRAAAGVRRGREARERDVRLGVRALAETILLLCKTAIPPDVLQHFPAEGEVSFTPPDVWEYKGKARVVAVNDDPDNHFFWAIDEESPEQPVRVRYNLPDRNDNFNPTIQVIRKVFGFPITMNLLEVDIDRQGDYRPRIFVLEPDYLLDISAISECFKENSTEPLYYLVKKFLPYEVTPAILLGNVANFFLDKLLNEPEAAYPDLLRETFQLYPFVYAPMSDADIKDISGKAQKHYLNIRQMTLTGFEQQGIDAAESVLEPTFYSEQYGIQGRLDLFYHTDEKAAIVELKSGQPFKPNSYGIARSHFTQTLLYDLLVRSVYGAHTDPAKYILYSGVDVSPLRFAPTVAPEQWEALQLRNQLVAIERLLANIQPGDALPPVIGRLTAAAGAGKGFLQRDFAQFETVYGALSALEKKYFNAFAGFIAREHWQAKVGEENSDTANGNAALWRSSFSEKQQLFSILSHLEIVENCANQPDPYIRFEKTEKTNPLANFRVGDIAVLYPAMVDTDTVLDHQVIKCTITELSKNRVTVQLRYRQFNLKAFETDGHWNLEPDLLDTGFVNMYRSLFEWAGRPAGRRHQILAPQPRPARNTADPEPDDPLLRSIMRSSDFFLLWGPPGTGKTSVVLHRLAGWVLRQSSDNILLLAYTNRAVDEICEALDALGGDIRRHYIRIGSRFSTAERFRDQLLNQQITSVRNRAELREILEKKRIFVGTVASFMQNEGLLQLKKFQRLVIDEASQLLEPQLVGLLSRFEHFVLIGDHRQLPAITTQRNDRTVVADADLNSIGLVDMRDSYFERLYRLCSSRGWTDHYACLEHQGRMHAEIMDFPNRYFYGGLLHILPGDKGMPQTLPLQYRLPGTDPVLEQIFSEKRVVFIPTPPEDALPGQKTSRTEAMLTVRLLRFFKELYACNELDWNATQTLGIITPWRAQIAQLRDSLSSAGFDPDELTIDTVERYQGGAREVIIISCCVHHEIQLASLINLSDEGVDRKLNVALTRARKHVVMLGNADVLMKDERYRAFIEQYRVDL